jgi:peptidyl-prolyl cis-trans isomerase B (cyclophilin B)
MEVADSIVSTKRDRNDKPLENQTIESATVELNGYNFAEPNRLV